MKKKPDSMLALVFLFCIGLAINALIGLSSSDDSSENFAHMQLLDYQVSGTERTANN